MTDERNDDFHALRGLELPPASDAARQRAVEAGLLAFDAALQEKETAPLPQGSTPGARLTSIVHAMKGYFAMDTRRLVPVGTAALALLVLLPLGYQFYATTALTPPAPAPAARLPAPPPPAAPMADQAIIAGSKAAAGMEIQQSALSNLRAEAPMLAAAPASTEAFRTGEALRRLPQQFDRPAGDSFAHFDESPEKSVITDPVSTFSIDVDTASYAYVRRSLNEGRVPPPDAVRVEEMINYFPYAYPAPTSAEVPFKPTLSVFPTPWNPQTELLQVGIKGYVPPAVAQQPANLVFLVDTSGSMNEADKLPLLQKALTLLVNTLPADDTVAIVAYAGSAGVVLEPTRIADKAKILTALNDLTAGGATAGAEGIALAYQLADQHKVGGNNRVILATDGDFNVGIDDPAQLKAFIKQQRQAGIGLSVLGFGSGNLDDAMMQALAQNGDGNASYIDNLAEAQKVLVTEAGATLTTIARDVKIQVEFNPALVSSYRLIGYETRALSREDFNNDKVDAGDVGAGHSVTALYEITPVGAGTRPLVEPLRYGAADNTKPAPAAGTGTELANFKLRYKLPGSDTSQLIEQPVTMAMAVDSIDKASNDARWAAAVAAFGQRLKGSPYVGTMNYAAIARLAQGARGDDPQGYRAGFLGLVGLAASLAGEAPARPATAE